MVDTLNVWSKIVPKADTNIENLCEDGVYKSLVPDSHVVGGPLDYSLKKRLPSESWYLRR
jgi:hypothetical protein